ncbi:hypothetical protein GDO81_027896 [Engystomops pustulosus]|uniref:Uncharacterized protein n=1 Tax=Engystomops pustulosus TaxID=76066 RepID=A0AAV6YG78_ENGPU|nr:hypothetical protein GDO81_027896 [Engystomops pustulosus]
MVGAGIATQMAIGEWSLIAILSTTYGQVRAVIGNAAMFFNLRTTLLNRRANFIDKKKHMKWSFSTIFTFPFWKMRLSKNLITEWSNTGIPHNQQ